MGSSSSSLPEPVPDSLQLTYVIGQLSRALHRELHVRMEEIPLGVPHFALLTAIRRREGLSNAQMAKRALVSPQAIQKIITTLERQGFITRERNPSNRRAMRTRLTPAGDAALNRAETILHGLERQLFPEDGYDAGHRELLSVTYAALTRLRTNGVVAVQPEQEPPLVSWTLSAPQAD